jgi:hypothetical protein
VGVRQLVVCMVGGMMDGSHGSCDDDFLFCCERV